MSPALIFNVALNDSFVSFAAAGVVVPVPDAVMGFDVGSGHA